MQQPEVIVQESILENKEVTKSYWEERMMSLSTEDVFDADEESGPAAASTPARSEDTEARIALELREMREREEELKQLRQRISSGNLLDSMATDEGNCSEYSSEENKEVGSIDGSSRVMSPEVPLQSSFGHHRTQSMDSMSSGHSSGSGGPQDLSITGTSLPFRRRVTVKPLDEPEEEESSYTKNRLNETPIEREIRLAAERELELKRDKGVSPAPPKTPTSASKQQAAWKPALANDSRDVQHRIATSRIQQEILEATQREKELVATGTIQTLSEDTVDSKVTRFTELAEYAMAEKAKHFQQPSQTDGKAQEQQPPPSETVKRPSVVRATPPSPHKSTPPPLSRLRSFEAGGQRGLMQRFIASKGQIVFNQASQATAFTETPTFAAPVFSPPLRREPIFELEVDRGETKAPPTTPIRKGFMKAEDKIQEELMEMKKREDELKLQRAHLMAQSQPNLLDIMDNGEDIEDEEEEIRRDVATLSKALSNPNLLDSSSYQEMNKPKPPAIRKRSALIDQWESLIQKNSQQA